MSKTLRAIARDKGKRWYKSDSTCVHGHKNPWRYTMTGGCRDCIRAKWQHNLPEDPNRPARGDGGKGKPKKVNRRKPNVKVCPHNDKDYRRTFKKWFKDKVANW